MPHSSPLPILLPLLLVALAGAGCSPATKAALKPKELTPAPLTLDSFAVAGAAQLAPALAPAPAPAPPAPKPNPLGAGSPSANDLSPADVTASFEGAPTPLPAQASANPVFAAIRSNAWVDEVVGNINGKPVYASVFLITGSPTVTALGPRLQREADLRTRNDWLNFATREITRAVNSFVEDELLRAEAIASLKPEERQGLFAFIDRAQRELERQSGGSRAAAEQRLLEEKGITIDEWRRQREDLELIRFELSNRIFQRVSVARRDIALRYQQLEAEFSKPPLATFRLIQASKDSKPDLDTITQLIATQGFEAAAKSKANLNKPAEGGLEQRELAPTPEATSAPAPTPAAAASEPPAPARLFANPKLDEAARSLAARGAVGESLGPIELTASIAWIRLESIEDRTTSLYDAQLAVEEDLRSQRVERERTRFIRQLSGRASDETIRDIVLRLLEVASQRYYPASKPEPVRPAPRR